MGVSINDHHAGFSAGSGGYRAIDAVQVIYNIFDQSPEAKLFPLCLERAVGVLARVPLDEGALTGDDHGTTTFEAGIFASAIFVGDRKKQVVEHVEAL